MSLLTLGINHKTAPVEIRERVVFTPDHLAQALKDMQGLPGVSEAAILSTCNRTEIYCELDSPDNNAVILWLAEYHKLNPQDLSAYLYLHPDKESIRHLLRVASGLDSMILGEPQILGQLKDAYRRALEAGTIGTLLGRLFQHTFSVAKQIRTDTAIGASPVSVAFAAVRLARQIFGDLNGQTALLIGAGETIELAARHLHDQEVGRIIVANRTVERAHDLAVQFNGYAIALSEIPSHLNEVDMVISSTASQTPILTREMVKQALKKRKHRPMFLVDIAVPRDIEAQVSELQDAYLYTVDDLHDVIEENLKSRQEAAQQAEEMIDVQVDHFMGWVQSLNAVTTIRDFRGQAEEQRNLVLEKAKQQLAQGKPAEEVLQYLAHTLTNKLIHQPSSNLKQAAYQGRQEVIKVARELFDLNNRTNK